MIDRRNILQNIASFLHCSICKSNYVPSINHLDNSRYQFNIYLICINIPHNTINFIMINNFINSAIHPTIARFHYHFYYRGYPPVLANSSGVRPPAMSHLHQSMVSQSSMGLLGFSRTSSSSLRYGGQPPVSRPVVRLM